MDLSVDDTVFPDAEPPVVEEVVPVVEEQIELPLEETPPITPSISELTPELLREKIDALGYSIRKAAEEMGMSHTTLSRYLNRKIKRQNKDNDQKMLLWLIAHS